jgi:LCP family protein required for cell wall assembly
MKRLVVSLVLGLTAMTIAIAPYALGRPAFVVHKVNEAHLGGASPSTPFFVLVVGSDARPGESGGRGDALHLIGVNPAQARATILNIPRDTYVVVPGHGRTKINDAFAAGGPALQGRVVGDLVGVTVSFVVSTDFAGFTGMVDELGGVDVNVPFAMNEPLSGARFAAGMNHMDGPNALAFSRNRHIPDGDIRRSEHQGMLILAALAKLHADTSATATIKHLAVLLRHARLDGVGLTDAFRLGRIALSLDPSSVRSVTMPSTIGTAGSASVVFPAAGADSLFADFRDDAVLQSH